MRRTLTVAALAAAMLVPAAAASADPGSSVGSNASCSNGKGGNAHGVYSGHGNTGKAADKCGPKHDGTEDEGAPVAPPVDEPTPDWDNS